MKLAKRHVNRALWVGGLLAGAAAVGVGVYYATKPQTLTSAPSTGPSTLTLDVQPGTSNAQISAQNGLVLQPPTGATITGLSVDGAPIGGASFSPGSLAAGAHTLSGSYQAAGAPAPTAFTINLTVLA